MGETKIKENGSLTKRDFGNDYENGVESAGMFLGILRHCRLVTYLLGGQFCDTNKLGRFAITFIYHLWFGTLIFKTR